MSASITTARAGAPAPRSRALRSAAETVAALAIACCLVACAIHPLLQDPSCDGEGAIDPRLASLVVSIFADGRSSLDVRDRLRAEALEGAPAGRWEIASERSGQALAACAEGHRQGALARASTNQGHGVPVSAFAQASTGDRQGAAAGALFQASTDVGPDLLDDDAMTAGAGGPALAMAW